MLQRNDSSVRLPVRTLASLSSFSSIRSLAAFNSPIIIILAVNFLAGLSLGQMYRPAFRAVDEAASPL
jgi:hypothetical protein